MNVKKIIAIGVIYIIGWMGWWILGTATALRSSSASFKLGPQVERLWGSDLVQPAPSFFVKVPGTDQRRELIPIENVISVSLVPDYRQKGLLWYSTFDCSFDGAYTIYNDRETAQKVYMHLDFPAKGSTYDEFGIKLNGERLSTMVDTESGIDEIIELAPGEKKGFGLHYKTRGMNSWTYRPAEHTGRVKHFSLNAHTAFTDVDFNENSLPPMKKIHSEDGGMLLKWEASDLITREDINIIIPEKPNPGPLTTRITYFAPVCLFFFFILITTIGIMFAINIHPMHYLFVAAGFFAFHLMLSYLAGHVRIHLAFAISALISVGLVTFYLRAALGERFPWKLAIAGQLFYLILFSYSFFIKGISGLIIATGSVVTLGILMKVTAGLNWDRVFQSLTRDDELELPEPETTL